MIQIIKHIFPILFLTTLLGCEIVNPLIDAGAPNTAPSAFITSPGADSRFPKSFTIVFQGTATDPEDGEVPDSSLVWFSTINSMTTMIGTGRAISVSTLAVGVNTISLEATDTRDETVTAQIRVIILDEVGIKPQDSTGSPGEDVSIPVFINDPNGIEAFGMKLSFPDTLLEFVSVTSSDLTQNFIEVRGRQIEPGMIILGGFHSEPIVTSEPGNLVMINFIVKNDASGQGTLNLLDLVDDIETAVVVEGFFSVE